MGLLALQALAMIWFGEITTDELYLFFCRDPRRQN